MVRTRGEEEIFPAARGTSRLFRQIPLLWAWLGPFILLLTLTVGLVGYISFRNAKNAVNLVAERLRGEITQRICEHLDTFLGTPQQINQLNVNALSHGRLNPESQLDLQQYFWRQLKVFESVTSIYFGNNKGGLVNSGREGPKGSQYVMLTDHFSAGILRKYATNSQGARTEVLASVSNFDVRTRQWYVRAKDGKGPAWSPVYILSTGQDMAIAASRPVYDREGNLLGVVSVDLFLSHLGYFLRHMKIGRTGQAYIIERSGELIASSTGDAPFTVKDGEAPQRRLTATESTTPIIRESARMLKKRSHGFENISSEAGLEFDIDDRRQFLQVSPVSGRHGLDWLVVVVIPEEDFMPAIRHQNKMTVLIIMAALAGALIVGIWAAGRIVRPISKLNRAAQALTAGQPSLAVPNGSRVKELRELTRSFNQMSTQLHSTFENLNRENIERKQAEEALRISGERLTLALEGADLGTWDWWIKTGFVIFGRRWAEILGYPLEELEPNIDTWKGLVHPEDRETVFQVLDDHLQGKSTHFETEHRLRHRSGRWIWVLNRGKVIERESDGTPVRACGTHLDITKRKVAEEALKESEEKYRHLFENSPVGLGLSTEEGKIIGLNEAMLVQGRYARGDASVLENTAIFYCSPSDRDRIMVKAKKQGFLKEEEVLFKRKDGTPYPALMSLSPVRIKNEPCWLAMVQDISQRKKAEEERESLIRRLQTALDEVRTLQGFLPICAHCKKIRDDAGYWQQIEKYIQERSEVQFTHGICPDCLKLLYPDYAPRIMKKQKDKT